MKTLKSLIAATLTGFLLIFIFSAALPVRADSDVTPVTYSWFNTDPEGTVPATVVTNFHAGDKTILPLMDYTGYSVDPNQSYIKFPSDDTETYAQIYDSLHVDSVNGFIALNNQNPATVTEDDLGLTTLFYTVLIPNDETVTVNYISSDGKKLDSKTIDTKFSRTITLDQPSFDGYTIAANQPNSYKVDKDGAGANVVTVTYDPAASSSSESSNLSSSNASSSSSANSSNTDSSNISGSSSSSSGMTSNDQSSAPSQSNSQSSNGQSIVAPLVKEDSSSNSSSNTPAEQNNNHDTTRHASLPSTSAIGYTTSVIGVVILSEVITLLAIKKRNH